MNNDIAVPQTKPNARTAVNNKVSEQKALINQNTEATNEEKMSQFKKLKNIQLMHLVKLMRLSQILMLIQQEMKD